MSTDELETGLDALPGKPGASDEIVYWALEELKKELDATQQGLLELRESQERIEEHVAGAKESEVPKYKPVSWSFRDLTGQPRRDLWATLLDFVDWINHRYFPADSRRNIPGCWIFHGIVVEELTGLWAAWHAAMRNHDSPNNDYAAWHRLYFWPAMDVIQKELQDCRALEGHDHSEEKLPERHPDLEGFLDRDCDSPTVQADPETGEI